VSALSFAAILSSIYLSLRQLPWELTEGNSTKTDCSKASAI